MVLVFIIINIILFGLKIILKVNCIGQLEILYEWNIVLSFFKISNCTTCVRHQGYERNSVYISCSVFLLLQKKVCQNM